MVLSLEMAHKQDDVSQLDPYYLAQLDQFLTKYRRFQGLGTYQLMTVIRDDLSGKQAPMEIEGMNLQGQSARMFLGLFFAPNPSLPQGDNYSQEFLGSGYTLDMREVAKEALKSMAGHEVGDRLKQTTAKP